MGLAPELHLRAIGWLQSLYYLLMSIPLTGIHRNRPSKHGFRPMRLATHLTATDTFRAGLFSNKDSRQTLQIGPPPPASAKHKGRRVKKEQAGPPEPWGRCMRASEGPEERGHV